jgi:predicted nucleic acid-binding protein
MTLFDCVVDTDVVSFLRRGDSRALHYREYLVGKRAALCFMSVAELRARAHIVAEASRSGHPIQQPADAWIAAAAWVDKTPLLTPNVRHFATVDGLQVVSYPP